MVKTFIPLTTEASRCSPCCDGEIRIDDGGGRVGELLSIGKSLATHAQAYQRNKRKRVTRG